MDVEGQRIRVVVMGDNRVGKSAILERFLKNTFQVRLLFLFRKVYSSNLDFLGKLKYGYFKERTVHK